VTAPPRWRRGRVAILASFIGRICRHLTEKGGFDGLHPPYRAFGRLHTDARRVDRPRPARDVSIWARRLGRPTGAKRTRASFRSTSMKNASCWPLLGAFALWGCRVNRAPMDAAHAERIDEIDREYSRDVAENDRRWAEVENKVLDLQEFMIEVEPGTDAKPKKPVVNDYFPRFAACKGSPEAPVSDGVRETCEGTVRESYWRAFAARYYRADFDWIQKQSEANPDLDVEWLATKSHNATVQASIDKSLAEIRHHKADFRRSLKDSRDDRVQLSAARRDGEVEAADQRRHGASHRACPARRHRAPAPGRRRIRAADARAISRVASGRNASSSTTIRPESACRPSPSMGFQVTSFPTSILSVPTCRARRAAASGRRARSVSGATSAVASACGEAAPPYVEGQSRPRWLSATRDGNAEPLRRSTSYFPSPRLARPWLRPVPLSRFAPRASHPSTVIR
jgi:hypothetical protein